MKSPPRSHGLNQARAGHSHFTKRVSFPLQPFLYDQVIAGAVLFAAAAAALIWANSPWADAYFHWREMPVAFSFGPLSFRETFHHFVNDALMALFFFSVGLEIKHELTGGELSNPRKALLPVIAAFGGVLVPALFYFVMNQGPAARGWAIPVATDIAFALGVLALFGRRVPAEGRIFLLTLATADDVVGILVIALFYSSSFSIPALAAAVLIFLGILLLKRLRVLSAGAYALAGAALWFAFYKSGIHAAISGVILGLVTPARAGLDPSEFQKSADGLSRKIAEASAERDAPAVQALLGKLEALTLLTESPLERAQRMTHAAVNFAVLPLFALANSGVPLSAETLSAAAHSPVVWGILAGLILGKPLGILAFSWCAVRLGAAALPARLSWRVLAGISVICGIGFTVSLFIVNLAFDSETLVSQAKLGVLAASLVSGIAGYFFLSRALKRA